MMRVGIYRPVHVKTLRSQKMAQPWLTDRKLLQSKAIAIENDLRGTLRNFGLKVGMVGNGEVRGADQGAGRELARLCRVGRRTADCPAGANREQIVILHRRLLAIVRDDEVCRRLMTTPGVGPVVALTDRATVDLSTPSANRRQWGPCLG